MKSFSESPSLKVLQGSNLKVPPCWLMRQAGRYLPEYREIRGKFSSFCDFLFSSSDVVEVTLQPLKRYDLDAAIIFSDILVIPMMLGQTVEVLEKKGPQLPPLTSPDEIKALMDHYNPGLCNPQYEAMETIRGKLPQTKSLIGFAGGPWTVASYMLEGHTSKAFNRTKAFAYRWPEAFQQLLDILADCTALHLSQQIKAGADIVKIFESWAGSVPENKIDDWIIRPHQRMIALLKKEHPTTPVIVFPKGLELSLNKYLAHVPIECIALGQNVNLDWAASQFQGQVALQGALDPQVLVVGGKVLEQEVDRQIQALNQGPYIFNLAHGIVPETPPEHVEALLRLIKR